MKNEPETGASGAMMPGDGECINVRPTDRLVLYVGSEKYDMESDCAALIEWLRDEWDRRDLMQGQNAIVALEEPEANIRCGEYVRVSYGFAFICALPLGHRECHHAVKEEE